MGYLSQRRCEASNACICGWYHTCLQRWGQDWLSHPRTLSALQTARSGAYHHSTLGHWNPQGSSQLSTLHLLEPAGSSPISSRSMVWVIQACHHSSQWSLPWHSPIHFHVSPERCRSSGDAAIPLHLCCWLSDVSCSHHKARHCLCCRSPCQIQLQSWTSSPASCQACTSLFEGHHTPQTCLPAFHLTRTLYHLLWCWSWWKPWQWQVHRWICGQDWLWSSVMEFQASAFGCLEARRSSGCISSWGSLAMTSLALH